LKITPGEGMTARGEGADAPRVLIATIAADPGAAISELSTIARN